jgi:hypothetical protein
MASLQESNSLCLKRKLVDNCTSKDCKSRRVKSENGPSFDSFAKWNIFEHSWHLTQLKLSFFSMVDTWHNTCGVLLCFAFFACYILVSFFLNLGLQLVFRQLETGSFIFEQGWDVMIQYPCTEWWVLSEVRYHFSILYFICEMQAGTSALHCTSAWEWIMTLHKDWALILYKDWARGSRYEWIGAGYNLKRTGLDRTFLHKKGFGSGSIYC